MLVFSFVTQKPQDVHKQVAFLVPRHYRCARLWCFKAFTARASRRRIGIETVVFSNLVEKSDRAPSEGQEAK
jgi:hypothetical protein